MSRSAHKICPFHKKLMVRTEDKHGPRWDCPEPGCTVLCWSGQTSTPADLQTRQARQMAHDAFDSLWKGHRSERARPRPDVVAIMSRDEAYAWLADAMGVEQKYAHIGMADKQQCKGIMRAVNVLGAEIREEGNANHGKLSY